MQSNLDLINSFFVAFQNKNGKAMWDHYKEEAEFEDPVFGELRGKDILAMWSMLVEGMGEESEIRYSHPIPTEEGAICKWEAIYTFAKTKRKIHNKIKSQFWIQDGKIVKQKDSFSFFKWLVMAFGWKALLMGWTPGFQKKVKEETKKSLEIYKKRRKIQ